MRGASRRCLDVLSGQCGSAHPWSLGVRFEAVVKILREFSNDINVKDLYETQWGRFVGTDQAIKLLCETAMDSCRQPGMTADA